MNVPDRDRLSMFETNHVAALAKDLVDYSSQIDLPHMMTAIARDNNGHVLRQHHQNSQIKMIDILVRNKHGIEVWQLGG